MLVDLPLDISGIDNISLSENLTANVANANIINSALSVNSNVGNFTGSLSTVDLTVTGDTTLGNSVSANYFVGNLFGVANIATVANSVALANVSGAGNIASLNLDGNASNVLLGNGVFAQITASEIDGLGNIATIDLDGNVSNVLKGDGTFSSVVLSSISNGTSRTRIPLADDSIIFDVNNSNNIFNVNTDGISVQGSNANIAGNLNVNGDVDFSGNLDVSGDTELQGDLSVNGDANVIGNLAVTSLITGDGGGLSNIEGGNVVNTVANATFADSAGTAGTVTTAAQPNITSVGILTGLEVISSDGNSLSTAVIVDETEFSVSTSGNIIDSANGNILQIAGVNYTLSVAGNTSIATAENITVSAGENLTFTSANFILGGNGDIVTEGDILANGNVTANSFNGEGSGLANLTGASVVGAVADATNADVANTVSVNAQPNITSVGTLTSLDVTGNITSGNVDAGNLLTANFVEGTLTTASQPNITSVGTLEDLSVTGNISGANLVSANFIQGDGGLLTNISVAAGSFIVNGNSEVRVDANSNVRVNVNGTSNVAVFSENGLGLGGFLSANNIIVTNGVNASTLTGELTTSSQPNITSLGNLTSLTVEGVSNLGPDSNVIITGGAPNAFLITDGAGNLAWTTATSTPAQGNDTEVIFNDGGNIYAGDAGLTYNKTTDTLTVSNSVVSGNVYANSGTVVGSLLTGTLTTNAQPNVTSLGTLTGLDVNGDLVAANITANTGLFSGDGGELSNIAAGNIVGTVASATSATTAGTVTTNAQPNITSVGTLSSLIVSGNINSGNIVGGNLVSANFFAGTLTTNAQPNVTSLGTLTGLDVNGDLVAANITANTGSFTGNGAGLTDLPGGNVTGEVANATFATSAGSATTAGTVTTNAQPNITSVGTLSSLIVSANINAGNVAGGNLVSANFFAGTLTTNAQPNITSVGTLTGLDVNGDLVAANITANTGSFTGNGAGLTDIPGGNVTGEVANATFATSAGSATTAGTVTTNAQPNITSVGTLSSLIVSGNINAGNVAGGNLVSANSFNGGNITASGYHIRSVATGISAAGSTQGTATVLGKEINVVSSATGTDGVKLPTAVAGMVITITNTTANSLQVYPDSGAKINNLLTDEVFVQGPGATLQFIAPTTTQWYTTGATYA